MSDSVYGYSIVVMAVIVLALVLVLARLLRRMEVAEDRARRAEKSLGFVREKLQEGRAKQEGHANSWRRPATDRFDEHTNRALRINDPDATQLNFRDMT